ncbi:MAG: CPBP family intramembrane metalloprotease [Deltaproteobacteria bacterium]|nr:CPBP family intramembrane metalloprotease [Deltaproteobacteria bacterium]
MDSSRSRIGFILAAAGFYGLILAASEASSRLWPHTVGYGWIGPTPWPHHLAWGLLAGLPVAVLSLVFAARTRAGKRLIGLLGEVLDGIPVWGALLLSLTAGLAEEAVFRGTLWTLIGSAWGDTAALAGTSLLFGAAHGLFRGRFLTWSVFALVTGVMLGCLRMVSGGVLAPAVAHAVIDAVNIPLVIRLYREGRP